MLIPVTAIVIENTTTTRVSQNKEAAFWLSLKTKIARSLVAVRGSSCMLRCKASGTTTLTQLALLVTGPLWVPLFTTASKIHLKTSSHFYVFVLGDGRLMSCERRITTAGSSPHWLGRLRRQHLMPVALTMAASTSTRSPWNLWILMSRLMNHLTCLD